MPPAISRTSAEPTLYEILSLSPKQLDGQASTAQKKTIKHAYRKALLKYHPDKNPRDDSPTTSPSPSQSSQAQASPPKSQPKSSSSSSGGGGKKSTSSPSSSSNPKTHITYTIDQIQQAYNVLSDGKQRREYDRHLLLASHTHSSHSHSSYSTTSTKFHTTGIETVDLDDLSFDEKTGIYFSSCRCGNARGYQFTDAELEEYEDDLVLMVQCLDCSLWLRVLFDAAEEEREEPQQSSSSTTTFPPNQNQNQVPASNLNQAGAFSNYGLNSANVPDQTLASQRGGAGDLARERSGSLNGTRRGKGWQFNFSFNWGISLSGSGSATASSSGRT